MREGLAFIANLISSHEDTALLILPVLSCIPVHACGVWVVFLEHGTLGICKSSARTYFIYNHASLPASGFLCNFSLSERSGRKPTYHAGFTAY